MDSIYRDLAPSVLGYLRARGAIHPEDLVGEVFLQVVRDLRKALQGVGRERVRRIIERLSPEQQAVLLLRVLGQLTIEEVATVVRKSPGAIKALQRRGLRAVERALVKEGVPL